MHVMEPTGLAVAPRRVERTRARALARLAEREIETDQERTLAAVELEALASLAIATIAAKLDVLRKVDTLAAKQPEFRHLAASVVVTAHTRLDDVFDRRARSLARGR